MANLNYAEQWSPELLEILMQGTLTSPFVTSNVRWLDAKTFHFTQMSTSGYKNHNRKGGWNTGTYDQKDIPYTLTHDRDVEFMVDKADVDETNATASIQNISRVFEQTWVVPETDALFFSKVAQAAQNTEVYHGSTATSAYTKAKVFGMLKAILAKGKLRRYKAQGSLIMYVRSEIMDALEQSTEFTRKIEMTQIAEGGMGIETRVTDIDGVPIMEVNISVAHALGTTFCVYNSQFVYIHIGVSTVTLAAKDTLAILPSDIKVQVWMISIPFRMQRIIKYKIFEEMTWQQVADRMGRKTTEESVRKEFKRFFEKI